MPRLLRWGAGTVLALTGAILLEGFPGLRANQATSTMPAAGQRGDLIPAGTTMVTAWDFPRNPMTDSTVLASPLGEQIRWGFLLFTNTAREAPRFSRNKLSCNNCHLNAGQREKAMPLVGVAGVFPEYNKREGRDFSLEDRVVGCFMRSQNASGAQQPASREPGGHQEDGQFPSTTSREVAALSAYITWLSEAYPKGTPLPWRGQNTIPPEHLIPPDSLNAGRGAELFKEKCSSCHGPDGQGVEIGDKKPGPLWGQDSWNDGAGAARVYTLAGMIRHSMPYLDPGSLSDEEAQQIAAFINSQPRPRFPLKNGDYRKEPLPPDALYYMRK